VDLKVNSVSLLAEALGNIAAIWRQRSFRIR
jgi:hypothetical protein